MGCLMLVFAFFPFAIHSHSIRNLFAFSIRNLFAFHSHRSFIADSCYTHTHKPRLPSRSAREAFWEEILNGLEEVDRLPHFFYFVAFMLYFLVVGIDQQLR